MSIESVITSIHLILCHPLLPLLPLSSIFPSIRVFSNDLALCIRWPKYWSFSFSINPSNEYSGLISFRMDWFDLLALYPASVFRSVGGFARFVLLVVSICAYPSVSLTQTLLHFRKYQSNFFISLSQCFIFAPIF